MRILLIIESQLPVTKYGGTERMVWYHAKELAARGHEVGLLVKEGSHSDFAQVYPIDESQSILEQIPEGYDILHFLYRPEGLEKLKTPYVLTIQGNLREGEEMPENTIFVSYNHAQRHGAEAFVYNGMDWDDYDTPDWNTPRKHFHFLAKASWRVKNVQGAINIINKSPGEKLEVLGGTRLNFSMGFRFTLSPKVHFEGMVGGHKKYQLINSSKGLLFPVRWHEPFGIAMIESLYYGCPVLGTPYGSLPELIHKDVGFLSDRESEHVEAVKNIGQFDPKICHEFAREEFNNRVMTDSYLKLYEKVLNGEKLNPQKPKLLQVQKEKFLPWYK